MSFKSFFKIAAFLLFFTLSSTNVFAAETLTCTNKGSWCTPVMETFCRTYGENIKNAQGKYYNYLEAIDCNKLLCCMEIGDWKQALKNLNPLDYPFFMQSMIAKNAMTSCWLCPTLERIFVTGNNLATGIYNKLRISLLKIEAAFFALMVLWLAFRVFVDFSGKEARSFLQKFAGLGLRLLIVAAILFSSPAVIGKLVYTPFINLGAGLGLGIMASSPGAHPHVTYLSNNLNNDDNIMGCTKTNDGEWTDDKMFTKRTCNAMVGLVQVMSAEVAVPIQYGMAFLLWGYFDRDLFIFPKFGPFITGFIIIITFLIVLVLAPYKVIDIFVQLAVVGCLTPLALTLFVFPATRSYTQGVWKMFISCILQLIMLSLMVALAVALMSGNADTAVLEHLLKNENQEAYDAMGLGGTGLLVTLCMAFIAANLLSKAGTFAQQLGGSVNLGLGGMLAAPLLAVSSKVGGMATGAAKKGLMAAGTSLLKGRTAAAPAGLAAAKKFTPGLDTEILTDPAAVSSTLDTIGKGGTSGGGSSSSFDPKMTSAMADMGVFDPLGPLGGGAPMGGAPTGGAPKGGAGGGTSGTGDTGGGLGGAVLGLGLGAAGAGSSDMTSAFSDMGVYGAPGTLGGPTVSGSGETPESGSAFEGPTGPETPGVPPVEPIVTPPVEPTPPGEPIVTPPVEPTPPGGFVTPISSSSGPNVADALLGMVFIAGAAGIEVAESTMGIQNESILSGKMASDTTRKPTEADENKFLKSKLSKEDLAAIEAYNKVTLHGAKETDLSRKGKKLVDTATENVKKLEGIQDRRLGYDDACLMAYNKAFRRDCTEAYHQTRDNGEPESDLSKLGKYIEESGNNAPSYDAGIDLWNNIRSIDPSTL